MWWFSVETRSVTEPAGALALAGLKRYIIDNNLVGAQKRFVAVVSGANMNFDRLRFVAERAELGEGREALLSVEVDERPGRYVPAIVKFSVSLTNANPVVSSPSTLLSTHGRLLSSCTGIPRLPVFPPPTAPGQRSPVRTYSCPSACKLQL